MPTLLLNNHTLTDVRPTVNVGQLSVCLAYITSFPGPRAAFGCEKRGHGLHMSLVVRKATKHIYFLASISESA